VRMSVEYSSGVVTQVAFCVSRNSNGSVKCIHIH
jgi:hypothetical protein